MITCDLAVVGGGPAGLAAAEEAVRHGLQVVIADDGAQPGGQFFRQPPPELRRTRPSPFDSRPGERERLVRVLDHPAVTWWPGTTVWDLPEPGVLAVSRGVGSGRVAARAVLLATGARDRAVPFPGWTLPGVVTAGGCLNLVKGDRVVPGERVVVAGNGPLALVAAATLVRAGVRVLALVESARLGRRALAAVPGMLAAPGNAALGLAYRARLARAGVPVIEGHAVVAAHGRSTVEAVEVAPIDGDGRLDRGRARRLDVDCLVTGYGLTPSTELARLAGCAMHFDAALDAWVPRRDRDLRTSLAWLFAAGDGVDVGGAPRAMVEGRLAAAGIAVWLRELDGAAVDVTLRRRIAGLRRRHRRMERFRRALAAVYPSPADWLGLATASTTICRCEDVTAEMVEASLDRGLPSLVRLKAETRAGMGPCQGRGCVATLARMVARAAGCDARDVALPRARPPARPIPLGDLLHEPIPPPDLPDDPHLPRGAP
ncbi:MAG: FAD-dependent oxidoreductase [Chromatiales bacterium]|nr:FAD-dependent oxidoreductase [Chromatiales bacterium]